MKAIIMPNPAVCFWEAGKAMPTVMFSYRLGFLMPEGHLEIRFLFPFPTYKECEEAHEAFLKFLATPLGQWFIPGLLAEWATAYPYRIVDDQDICLLNEN